MSFKSDNWDYPTYVKIRYRLDTVSSVCSFYLRIRIGYMWNGFFIEKGLGGVYGFYI